MVRHFELLGLPDGSTACAAFVEWTVANGASVPACDVSEPGPGGASSFSVGRLLARDGEATPYGDISLTTVGRPPGSPPP